MSKQRGYNRTYKGLSNSDFLLIAKDDRPQREIATAWGISRPRVNQIKRDWTFKQDSFIVGDAEKVLDRMVRARVRVDCVITSPPYNLGLKPRNGGTNWNANKLAEEGYGQHQDNMPRADYVKWQRRILGKCLELVGSAGVVFWNLKPILRDGISNLHADIIQDMPVRQEIIWDRGSSNNHDGSVVPPTHEKVFMLCPSKRWKLPDEFYQASRKWGSVWRIPPAVNNPHPAPFPLELALRMALASKSAILDPFAGSGTVGLAARELGLPFYLIDNDHPCKEMWKERRRSTELGDTIQLFMGR